MGWLKPLVLLPVLQQPSATSSLCDVPQVPQCTVWDAPGISAAKALRLALPAPLLLAWFEGVTVLWLSLKIAEFALFLWKHMETWLQTITNVTQACARWDFSEAILYLFQLQLAFMQLACSLVNSVVIRTRHIMSTWPCFRSGAREKEILDATTKFDQLPVKSAKSSLASWWVSGSKKQCFRCSTQLLAKRQEIKHVQKKKNVLHSCHQK